MKFYQMTEVDYLKEKSDFKGIALLFHAWFIIGLSVLVYSFISKYIYFFSSSSCNCWKTTWASNINA